MKPAVKHNALVALVFAFCLNASVNLSAQSKLPDTDIYLIPLTQTDTGFAFGAARIATELNRYDDFPSFTFDSQYMYYSTERDDYKTDIYAVYLPQFQNVEFISTGTVSEFVPLQKPNMTGLALVRDNNDIRQVWFYGTYGTDKCLTPNQNDVASFTWFNDALLALNLSGKQNTLCILNTETNSLDTLVKNTGSSIAKVPSENALYYTTTEKGIARLMRYNYDTRTSDSLVFLPGGAKDFTVAIDGSLWAANEGVVYRWPRAAEKWNVVSDYGSGQLGGAFRVALSRDMKWLAVVTTRKL